MPVLSAIWMAAKYTAGEAPMTAAAGSGLPSRLHFSQMIVVSLLVVTLTIDPSVAVT